MNEIQITEFPPTVRKKLGSYVYIYIDTMSNEIFYVGKGKDNHALTRLNNPKNEEMVERNGIMPDLQTPHIFL